MWKSSGCVVLSMLALMPGMLRAATTPDKAVISNADLKSTLTKVKAWATTAAELRDKAPSMDPKGFVSQVEPIRTQLEEVLITIITTKPAPADQQAAMLLAMGTKGVELALWHYLYGAMSNNKKAMEHGDVLLKVAMGQIEAATMAFDKPVK